MEGLGMWGEGMGGSERRERGDGGWRSVRLGGESPGGDVD